MVQWASCCDETPTAAHTNDPSDHPAYRGPDPCDCDDGRQVEMMLRRGDPGRDQCGFAWSRESCPARCRSDEHAEVVDARTPHMKMQKRRKLQAHAAHASIVPDRPVQRNAPTPRTLRVDGG
jgi:hypothetical protein